MNTLEYKGYRTNIKFDEENSVLYGKIEGINDLITFEGTSQNIVEEFHSAVDDYLIFCDEIGKSPEKEYRGKFNLCVKSEFRKKLPLKAINAN